MGAAVLAAGFIIFRKNIGFEFLVMKSRHGGHWGTPKGRLEPGETNYQAAVRETAEETGLREHQLKVVDGFQRVLHYTSYNKLKDVTYWLAELLDGEAHIILSKEHTEFQWLSLNEACINMHYEDMKKAVTDAHEFLLTQS